LKIKRIIYVIQKCFLSKVIFSPQLYIKALFGSQEKVEGKKLKGKKVNGMKVNRK
jgi:hypothetical protein